MNMNKQENGRYPVEFRLWVAEQLKAGVPVSALAKRIGVRREVLYRWKKNPLHPDSRRNQSQSPKSPAQLSLEEQLREAMQLLAQKAMEVEFFKGALQRIEARRRRSGNSGVQTSTDRSGK